MSTQQEADQPPFFGAPELTPLGKRIEMLRIERGISKQHLARHAGTSRQQLWRVMTGKSELSRPLRDRLLEVFGVDVVSHPIPTPFAVVPPGPTGFGAPNAEPAAPVATPDLQPWLADARYAERTMRSLPGGPSGRRLKRALLDLLEDAAAERRLKLSPAFAELRRKVLNDEL